ncbi:MAG: thiamine phosphate synthase [Candidatus Omnitrophica bacterium]|nr:thiamine phosphate synthase [Candidatus Omnitrophota bacterium]
MKGYYFITDKKLSRLGNLSDVKNAIKAGVKIVQYREKEADTKEMYGEAIKLRKICNNVFFLINDRIDIALAANADGVHLGQSDMPYKVARKLLGKNKIIGITVHNLKEARLAQRLGANYIGISPVFETRTKPDAKNPVGIKLIKKIKQRVSLPIVAIGGINLSNARDVVFAGANCICAISAVITKKDVAREIEKFNNLFKKQKGGGRGIKGQ